MLDRRAGLGLSQAEITARGGPAEQTLRNIEHGKPNSYSRLTLAKLERVLCWRPGVAREILNGIAPQDGNEWLSVADVDHPTAVIDDLSKVLAMARQLSRAEKVRAIHEIAIMLAAD